ncbi:MAG: hypothetical protein RJA70_720 [Pseudomonadota bacterium]|jgi:hypothetical protein
MHFTPAAAQVKPRLSSSLALTKSLIVMSALLIGVASCSGADTTAVNLPGNVEPVPGAPSAAVTEPGGAAAPTDTPPVATLPTAAPSVNDPPAMVDSKATIDAVFFAQTHVQRPDDELFRLVSNRAALIKVHVIAPDASASPAVSVVLALDGKTETLTLMGPATLPPAIDTNPGTVQHTGTNTFTGMIPKQWIQPGVKLLIRAGQDTAEFNELNIGAPTRVVMNMFDLHYFAFSEGGYAAGWEAELESKWPVSALEVRRAPSTVFPELVVPPRGGIPATRIKAKAEYKVKTGLNFDGEQLTALKWKGALKDAAGTAGRVSLYYANIHGVGAGGQAGGFGGVGNGSSLGILNHELGHALSLLHWANVVAYPYRGDSFGIAAPKSVLHVGPTWAFDLRSSTFIPPTVQVNSVGGVPGTWKQDPMAGGGVGDQEMGFLMRHFSDYSVAKMQNYLEGHVVIWDDALGSYVAWDDNLKRYATLVVNDGVKFANERNVEVVSVMAAICAANQDVNMVYTPIGPYTSGLIDVFDPANSADRAKAAAVFCPAAGCDVSLRIVQGGVTKTLMLAAPWNPADDPLTEGSLFTRAVNLPAKDGAVTRAELLLTPDAQIMGLPSVPVVLNSWAQ